MDGIRNLITQSFCWLWDITITLGVLPVMPVKKRNYPWLSVILLSLVFSGLVGCDNNTQENDQSTTDVIAGQNQKQLPFDSKKWIHGRYNNPEYNVSPWMVDDLMENHLPIGISLDEVITLLGQPVVSIDRGRNATELGGEYSEETVYVYNPGYNNGWYIESAQPIEIHFCKWGSSYSVPGGCKIRHVDASTSNFSKLRIWKDETIGKTYCAIPNTIALTEELLGKPVEVWSENHLSFYLGKKSRTSFDDVYLELHFDQNKKLTEIIYIEH